MRDFGREGGSCWLYSQYLVFGPCNNRITLENVRRNYGLEEKKVGGWMRREKNQSIHNLSHLFDVIKESDRRGA